MKRSRPVVDEDHAKKRVKKEYDRASGKSVSNRDSDPLVHYFKACCYKKGKLISRYSPEKSKSVLDIACGQGGDLLRLKDFETYYGFDLSDERIKELHKRKEGVRGSKWKEFHAFVADFMIPATWVDQVKGKTFDLINMQWCVHYFMGTISEMHDWLSFLCFKLNPGGRIIMTFLDWPRVYDKYGSKFKNSVCSYEATGKDPDLWAKLHFKLGSNVDSIESVVHTPCLLSVAKDVGLKTISLKPFDARRDVDVSKLTRDEIETFNMYTVLVLEKNRVSFPSS